MKNIIIAYYNLGSKIVKRIELALDIKLIEYNIGIVPKILFCDINEYLDEQFLEYMFNNKVIIARISEYSSNPLVFQINDDVTDTYIYDKLGKEYIKCTKKNMDIFSEKLSKLIELNITPSFLDIPNSIDIIKNTNYFTNMVNYIEYLDMSEVGHSIRVAQYSKMLAKEINYDNPDLLYIAGILHDIGKSLVSEDIRFKRRKLSDEEFLEMKKHSIYSCNLLNKDLYNPIIDIILYHHERCNGSGYPFHTKNIPLGSKIIAIADSYDAMTSSRIYVDFKTKQEAIQELIKHANEGLYEKYLVDKFIKLLYIQN